MLLSSPFKAYAGEELTVIACCGTYGEESNPAFSNVDVPLASSFVYQARKASLRQSQLLKIINTALR